MNYENTARYFIRGTVGTPSYWPAIYVDHIKESGHRLFFLLENFTAYLNFHPPFSFSFFPFFHYPRNELYRASSTVCSAENISRNFDFGNPTEVKARGVDAISHKHAQCEGREGGRRILVCILNVDFNYVGWFVT